MAKKARWLADGYDSISLDPKWAHAGLLGDRDSCWARYGSGGGWPGRCSGASHIIVYNQYLLGATCNTQMCQFLLSMA